MATSMSIEAIALIGSARWETKAWGAGIVIVIVPVFVLQHEHASFKQKLRIDWKVIILMYFYI